MYPDAVTEQEKQAEVERPYVPTLDEIRNRWETVDAKLVPMVFTNHAKMDIAVLLETIDELTKFLYGKK